MPPLFLDQTEARKNSFETAPPPPLSSHFNLQGRLNPLIIVLRPRSGSLICSGSLSPMYGCIENKQSCQISPLIT